MEDRFYSIVHEKPYNHLEEEAFLREKDPDLFRELTKEAASLPGDLVREYGLDCVLYFIRREKAGDREFTEKDEDALCGIFRFLGRVYRAFAAEKRKEEEGGPEDERFYALCAGACTGLESGHLHLYEAGLAKALPHIQKGRGGPAERELFLLLLRETAPCLSARLLETEGISRKHERARIRDLLDKGKAGTEAVVQVMGKTKGRLLVRPGEAPEDIIKRGEILLKEAGQDMSGLRVRYIPGKVISFWK